jgi:methanogenic corrinoid protein MtbC1
MNEKLINLMADMQEQETLALAKELLKAGTNTFDSMKKTVEAIEGARLRDKVKIMIGGGQIDEEVRKCARADAYGKDAVAAVQLSRQWIGA